MGAVEDRVRGVLFGLAAGDRNGGPVRMALLVAESLDERGTFDAEDVGARYQKWWRSGEAFDTGPPAAQVLRIAASGGLRLVDAPVQADATEGGLTAGCNPAHRSAPLAMCASIEDSMLDPTAKTEARLTHVHPLAGDTAAFVVILCRALIRGCLVCGPRHGGGRPDERNPSGGGSEKRHGALPGRIRSGCAAGSFDFVSGSESFSEALARSLAFAGPANFSPVLVGSVGGARWGMGSIEERDLAHQSNLLPKVRSLSERLARSWTDRHAVGP